MEHSLIATEKEVPGVLTINEGELKNHLSQIVRSSVEETLNTLLDAEADALCKAQRYERNTERVSTRAGHYQRNLLTSAGSVKLNMPKLRNISFETAIIELYRRRESSVEEALVEMYLAGVSVRRVEDITEALWGTRVSPSTVSDLNQKIYANIESWRKRPLNGQYPYIFLDGIWLKRAWGGEVRNVAVLVGIGMNSEGYREILGVSEGGREDTASWLSFLRELKERGLNGVQLVISDKCLGLLDALSSVFPEARWQRCAVHYRDILRYVPKGKSEEVARMLKTIHAQEDQQAAKEKIRSIVGKLQAMKLADDVRSLEQGGVETLTYYNFLAHHWRQLRPITDWNA
jgi:putative transposase